MCQRYDMSNHPITAYRSSNRLSLSQFAERVGVSRSYACQWETGARRVPAERAVEIERLTGIPREQLRPDLFQKEQDHAVAST